MTQSSKSLSLLLALALTLLLAACSSTPSGKTSKKDTADEPLIAFEGAPAGLDVTAPDENPYLAQAVEVPGVARNLFRDSVNAMQANDLRKAEILLQQLTTEFPNLSGPFLNLGIVYRQQDKYTNAEAAFKQAIAANALNFDAYNQLGLLMREQGKFPEAEAYYIQALQGWPKHAQTHKNLGILYDLYLGKWDKALQHFEIFQYLQTEPDRTVNGWIIDLRRRINENATAGGQR